MTNDWDQMTDQKLILLLKDNPGDFVEPPMDPDKLAPFKCVS